MKQVARSSTPRSALPRTPAIGSAGLRQCRHVQTCRHRFAVLDPRLPGWRRAASLGRMAQWLTAIVQAPTAAPAPSSLPVLSPQRDLFGLRHGSIPKGAEPPRTLGATQAAQTAPLALWVSPARVLSAGSLGSVAMKGRAPIGGRWHTQ